MSHSPTPTESESPAMLPAQIPGQTPAAPKRAPKRHPARHLTRRRVVLAAVAVLAYVLVIVLYALSGRVGSGDAEPEPVPGGVVVTLTPQAVDATGETISMRIGIDPSDELTAKDGVTLTEALTVVVSPVGGEQTVEFPAGAIPATRSIDLVTSGAVENWPFDVYSTQMVAVAFPTKAGFTDPLPTTVYATGYLPGWNLTAIAHDPQNDPTIDVSAARSWSTLAFGILLLGLMVLIACLVLYVSITVYRGQRKVEASFMSWIGAMLFATIPLRGFLPGSPPIGSWIDYIVVLWVIVGLVTGLGVYVTAWTRWGSAADAAAATAPETTPPAPEG